MSINIQRLQVFIDSVSAFFEQIDESIEAIDTPYLHENVQPIGYDFTGLISISGPYQGCVYLTAPAAMMEQILIAMDEPDITVDLIEDLVGEIANTVAGNARTEFGADFIISTPKVINGRPNASYLPKDMRSFVIPFHWHRMHAALVICLYN